MESRFAGGVVAVSLIIVAFGLVLWLIRLSRSAISSIGALFAGLALMLAAALQFGWATMHPSAKALRLNAARYALYGVGAFLVAAGHLVLTTPGSDLLK